jgi:hypothetical protein
VPVNSYLLRVVLPDRPGALGLLATALGAAGIDIVSLDVVERGPEGAVDDLLVELPRDGFADGALSAAQSVPGVTVESLRPFHRGRELTDDLSLVDALAAADDAVRVFVDGVPGVFRAGWAFLLEAAGRGQARVLAASPTAPDLAALPAPWLPLTSATRLDRDDRWVPERWNVLGMELMAAPLGAPGRGVLVGRPGGPRFRAAEVVRLAHLTGIAATVTRLETALTGR